MDSSEGEESASGIIAFIDTVPNLIRILPRGRESARIFLQNEFTAKLDSMIDRYGSLGYLLFSAEAEFVTLVIEARRLFVQGFQRGAVALCGTAVEFICDHVIRNRVSTEQDRNNLLSLDFRRQVEKLKEARKFRSTRTGSVMHQIFDIRNDYVHPRGVTIDEKRVHRAIQMLNLLVVAEFGLVPGEGGRARTSTEDDVTFFARELGLSDLT